MRLFFLSILLLLNFSCAHFQLHKSKEQQVLEQIKISNAKKGSLEAILDIHGGGFAKLLGSSKVDAVVQSPNQLFLSFRSFFDTPGLVISSDGEDLYYFRILESGQADFQKANLNRDRNKIEKILPSFLNPEFFVDLILGRVHLENTNFKLISSQKIRRSNLVKLELESFENNTNQKLILEFDVVHKIIKKFKNFDAQNNLISSAKYENFVKNKNILIAQNIDAQVKFEGKLLRLKVALSDIELNKKYDSEVFQIQN